MSVYVCSDFHGFKSLYDQIHQFLKPEDHVYFLGDAADRGPNGWECIKAILDDEQWTYILGNHDFFFIRAVCGPYMRDHSMEHYSNGGRMTTDAYYADDPETRRSYMSKLQACSYYATYLNKNGELCYMSHSGAYKTGEYDEESFVWDRSHFLSPVPAGIDFIVHGHTTIPHLIKDFKKYADFYDDITLIPKREFEPGHAFWYEHGNKCDVDCCTISSGSCVLLDLDTYEEYSFFVNKEEEEYLWL